MLQIIECLNSLPIFTTQVLKVKKFTQSQKMYFQDFYLTAIMIAALEKGVKSLYLHYFLILRYLLGSCNWWLLLQNLTVKLSALQAWNIKGKKSKTYKIKNLTFSRVPSAEPRTCLSSLVTQRKSWSQNGHWLLQPQNLLQLASLRSWPTENIHGLFIN